MAALKGQRIEAITITGEVGLQRVCFLLSLFLFIILES